MDPEERHLKIDQNPLKMGIFLVAGLLLLGWTLSTPPGIFGKADAIGYAVCHRIDARSFHIGTRQLPLCVRCSGQYLGALFGIIYLGITAGRRVSTPSRPVTSILFLFVLAYAVDGLNSYFQLPPMIEIFPSFPRLYEPSNELRLLTGSGMGFSISVAVFLTFNRTIWTRVDRRRVIENIKHLGAAVFLLLLLDILVLSGDAIVLYPLAILSALSVILLLSMVYALVITMILHMENSFSRISQLSVPLTAGFIIAMMQLAVFDALRFLLTGTWEGFQL